MPTSVTPASSVCLTPPSGSFSFWHRMPSPGTCRARVCSKEDGPMSVSVRPRTIHESRGDRIFLWAIYGALGLIFIIVAYPLLFILAASFSSAQAVIDGQVWLWPVHWSLAAYKGVFHYQQVWTGFLNALIYTVASTVLSVTLTIMMGYPLSRRDLVGRRIWVWLLLFALMFNGGLIPFYLIVKNLGMLNTRWSMIVPSAMSIFSVILAKTFFQSTVSEELFEAAQIDGVTDFGFLWRIALPTATPIIAVLALLSAVGTWNSYFNALIFLNSQSLWPLQLVLRQILILSSISASGLGLTAQNLSPAELQYLQNMQTLLQYALIVVATVPMMLLYPLAQRYFIKGVMIGSLKE